MTYLVCTNLINIKLSKFPIFLFNLVGCITIPFQNKEDTSQKEHNMKDKSQIWPLLSSWMRTLYQSTIQKRNLEAIYTEHRKHKRVMQYSLIKNVREQKFGQKWNLINKIISRKQTLKQGISFPLKQSFFFFQKKIKINTGGMVSIQNWRHNLLSSWILPHLRWVPGKHILN